MNKKKVTFTLDEIESLFCTKEDIEAIAITGCSGHCLTWLNSPYCWFEDALKEERNAFRKMAKQMNFLRKIKGQKPINKK